MSQGYGNLDKAGHCLLLSCSGVAEGPEEELYTQGSLAIGPLHFLSFIAGNVGIPGLIFIGHLAPRCQGL